MGHPDSGSLQALLDGELDPVETRELRIHAEACQECRFRLEDLEASSKESADALGVLDLEPDVDAARSRLWARREGVNRARPFFLAWSLPKAASIALLLTCAAATALPGSPVRRWLAQGWEALIQSSGPGAPSGGSEVAPEDPTPSTSTQDLEETGAGIPAYAGGVEIWIHGLTAESDLRVLWTDGEEAWIYAGEGTRFTSTDGRLEAFGPPGPVRVEIPRSVGRVLLGLDGEVLLRKSGGGLEILGPVLERSPSEIRFEPLPPPNHGSTPGVINP